MKAGMDERCSTMGLGERGNRLYYYEKRRIAGRVFSRYIGGGLLAELAAETSATARQERDQRRWEQNQARYEQKQIDRQLAQAETTLATILRIAMRSAGFHQHKGQWRKKRRRGQR